MEEKVQIYTRNWKGEQEVVAIMKGVVPGQNEEWDKLLILPPAKKEISFAIDVTPTKIGSILSLIVVETHDVLEDDEEVTIRTRMVRKKK